LFASPDHVIKKEFNRNKKQMNIKTVYETDKVIDFINNYGRNIDEQQKMYNAFIFLIKLDYNLSKTQYEEANNISTIQIYEAKKKIIIDTDRMNKKAIMDKKEKVSNTAIIQPTNDENNNKAVQDNIEECNNVIVPYLNREISNDKNNNNHFEKQQISFLQLRHQYDELYRIQYKKRKKEQEEFDKELDELKHRIIDIRHKREQCKEESDRLYQKWKNNKRLLCLLQSCDIDEDFNLFTSIILNNENSSII